uniref:CAP domain-containing protein (inferred by orthology to a human protein) n=1 Tax=Strongyloides venezuelensis TaxID=75913 RepID=A0A0K0FCB0_STRVS
MIILFLNCYIISQLVIQSFCQITSNVQILKKYGPGGTITYNCNGRDYYSLNDVYKKIQEENPNSRFIFQGSEAGGSNGNSIFSKNSRFNGFKKYFFPFWGNGGYKVINKNSNLNTPGQYNVPDGNIVNKNRYPNNGISNSRGYNQNRYPYIPSDKFGDYLNDKFYGKNPYSDKISKYIWNGYDLNSDRKNKFKQMKKRFMEESNQYRSKHQVGKLITDSFLENEAQSYANYLAKKRTLQHDYKSIQKYKMGENLGYASGPSAHLIVKLWYDENTKYNYRLNSHQSGTGHFSQLVWASSRKAGFGVAEGIGNSIYVVCRYSPQGNIGGQYISNVRPPRK